MQPTRRELMLSLAAPALLGSARAETEGRARFSGMIVRMHEPRNLEFPVSELRDAIIPTDQFFVRSHFAVPEIDPERWRLSVTGAVERPLELTLRELRDAAKSRLTLTMECAGNGRVHLAPPVPGLQWGQGAVGNAVWEGVPLGEILERAKVRKSAVEVVLVGADQGPVNTEPRSPGPIHFARSLPLDKARRDEVLLAYAMNGEPLTPAHGYPLRAVVGGWYGMASIKWLTRIVVTDRPFQGFWQTLDYSYFERRDGIPTLVPITAMQPKAIIARPGLDEVIPAGQPYSIFGAAWAGERAIAKVEVSVDGGTTWQLARLRERPQPLQWVLWEWLWPNPRRGPARIVARATDDQNRSQPAERDPDRRTYMINHLVPLTVRVA